MTPVLGMISWGPWARGSSRPAMRPAKQVQAPLYSGPSPTLARPSMPCGTCFSPARNVLLVPSLILEIFVLLVKVGMTTLAAGGGLVAGAGVALAMMIAPLLLLLNQSSMVGLFGMPRMSPTQAA